MKSNRRGINGLTTTDGVSRSIPLFYIGIGCLFSTLMLDSVYDCNKQKQTYQTLKSIRSPVKKFVSLIKMGKSVY